MQSATRMDTKLLSKHILPGPVSNPTTLANIIIDFFFLPPIRFLTPLVPDASANVQYLFKKRSSLNTTKRSGPDNIPAWLLKKITDLLAPVVSDTPNCSYSENQLPQSWKFADIVPNPKQTPVYSVNKHLRPFSLTPILSKLDEEFVVDRYICETTCVHKS